TNVPCLRCTIDAVRSGSRLEFFGFSLSEKFFVPEFNWSLERRNRRIGPCALEVVRVEGLLGEERQGEEQNDEKEESFHLNPRNLTNPQFPILIRGGTSANCLSARMRIENWELRIGQICSHLEARLISFELEGSLRSTLHPRAGDRPI